MATPDMHEHLLGQYQRQQDFYADLEDAEAAAYKQAKREWRVALLEAISKADDNAIDMMADFDSWTGPKEANQDGGYDVLAALAKHIAAGSVDAGLARVTRYLEAVVEAEAHHRASRDAQTFVERTFLGGEAA